MMLRYEILLVEKEVKSYVKIHDRRDGEAWISLYYFRRVAYICPKCHAVFKPSFKQAFWAKHTPTTRKLTCTSCSHKGFCVGNYGGED